MQPSTAPLRFESGGPARPWREFRSRAATDPVAGSSRLAGTLPSGAPEERSRLRCQGHHSGARRCCA